MILKYGNDMKKDIVKLSQGWESEIFYTIHDYTKANEIVRTIIEELFVYIDSGCELEEENEKN